MVCLACLTIALSMTRCRSTSHFSSFAEHVAAASNCKCGTGAHCLPMVQCRLNSLMNICA